MDSSGRREEMLPPILDKLREIESAANLIDLNHRDHLIHTFNTYLLGHYFTCSSDVLERKIRVAGFLNKWSFIATAHDLAYPLEIFSKQISKYLKDVTKPAANSNIKMEFNLKNLESFVSAGGTDYFSKIQRYLDQSRIQLDIRKYFVKELSDGYIDHGIFCALLLEKLFPDYQDITEVSSAIALHNIDSKIEISIERHPLAWLLILSDELQEWDRKSSGRSELPPTGIDICIKNKRIKVKMASDRQTCILKEETIKKRLDFSEIDFGIDIQPMIKRY